jgi:hypothetical protein
VFVEKDCYIFPFLLLSEKYRRERRGGGVLNRGIFLAVDPNRTKKRGKNWNASKH